ncbi:hypothetical protein [Jannaschia sp. 2305UL9-9]|uniref:hypothetical protein n=1 Tax=Jannaschia sp. 2305UL9-9 TaxID=3121638 RepID=UPI0035292274
MVTEPESAPVPEKSKPRYYVGLAIAIAVGILLIVFIFPNLLAMVDDSPAVTDDFKITLPSGDGLERVDPVQ